MESVSTRADADQHPGNTPSFAREASNYNPAGSQASRDPIPPLAASVIRELQLLIESIQAARHAEMGSAVNDAMTKFQTCKDTLDARISEYDKLLQSIRAGNHHLAETCEDRTVQLAELDLAYEDDMKKKAALEDSLVKLQQEERSTRSKVEALSSGLARTNKDIDRAKGKVRIIQQEEQQLKESMRRLNDQRNQDDEALEAKRVSLQEQEANITRAVNSITEKQKEHNDKVAQLLDLQRTTQEAVSQSEIRLAALDNAMAALRSPLDLLGPPATYETVEQDVESITKVLKRKLEGLTEDTVNLRGLLSTKTKAAEKHQRELKEAKDAKWRAITSQGALNDTVVELRDEIDTKAEELEVQTSHITSLTEQLGLLKSDVATAQTLNDELQKDSDAKQAEVDAQNTKIRELNGRIELLQKDQAKANDIECLYDGLQSQLDEKTQLLVSKDSAVSDLTGQVNALTGEKERADNLHTRNQALQGELEKRKQAMETQHSELTRLAGEGDKAEKLSTDNQTLRKELKETQQKVETMNNELTRLAGEEDKAKKLSTDNQTLRKKLKETQQKVETMNNELTGYRRIEMQAQQSAATWSSEKRALNDSLVEKQEHISRLEGQLAPFKKQKPVVDWETEVAGLTGRINALAGEKDRAKKLDALNRNLQQELQKKGRDMDQRDSLIKELTDQVNSLIAENTAHSVRCQQHTPKIKDLNILVDIVRGWYDSLFDSNGEQLSLQAVVDQIETHIASQDELKAAIKLLYGYVDQQGPLPPATAALQAVDDRFLAQSRTKADLEVERDRMKEETSVQRNRLRELNEEQRRLTKKLRLRDAESTKQEKVNSTLQDQIRLLKSQLAEATSVSKKRSSRIDKDLDADLEALQKQLDAGAVASQQVDTLQQQVNSLQQQNRGLNTKLAEANHGRQEAAQKEARALQRVKDLASQLSEATSRQREISEGAKGFEDRISSLENQLSEANRRRSDTVLEINMAFQGQIAELKRQLSESNSRQMGPTPGEVMALQDEVAELKRQLSESNSRQMGPTPGEVMALQDEVAELKRQLSESNTRQIRAGKEEIGALRNQVADLKRQLSESNSARHGTTSGTSGPLHGQTSGGTGQSPESSSRQEGLASREAERHSQGRIPDIEDEVLVDQDDEHETFPNPRRQGDDRKRGHKGPVSGKGKHKRMDDVEPTSESASDDETVVRRRKRPFVGGASRQPSAASRGPAVVVQTPARACNVLQWNVRDVRRRDFRCSLLPLAIVHDIQRQIERWDKLRSD
ncbi:MAG: hypothetical protein LQ338_004315, partial [Usnochroma carphineum]